MQNVRNAVGSASFSSHISSDSEDPYNGDSYVEVSYQDDEGEPLSIVGSSSTSFTLWQGSTATWTLGSVD